MAETKNVPLFTLDAPSGRLVLNSKERNGRKSRSLIRNMLSELDDLVVNPHDPSESWKLIHDQRYSGRNGRYIRRVAVDTMNLVDKILNEIIAENRPEAVPVDNAFRDLAKELMVMIQLRRMHYYDNDNFKLYNESGIRMVINEMWYTRYLHREHVRKDDSPYEVHLFGAAKNVVSLTGLTGIPSVIGAFRHDDFEDLPQHQPENDIDALLCDHYYAERLDPIHPDVPVEVTIQKIRMQLFEYVDGVTNVKDEDKDKQQREKESFYRMLSAIVKNLRVLYLRGGDRGHNMETIEGEPVEEKRVRKARQTISAHAPSFRVVKLDRLFNRMVEDCFKVLNPEALNEFYALREERLEAFLGPKSKRRQTLLYKKLQKLSKKGSVHYVGLQAKPFAEYANLEAAETEHALNEVDPWDPMYEVVILTDSRSKIRGIQNDIEELLGPDLGKGAIDREEPALSVTPYPGVTVKVFNPALGGRVWVRINDMKSESLSVRGVLAENTTLRNPMLKAALQRVLDRTRHDVENIFKVASEELLKPAIVVRTPNWEAIELPSGARGIDFAAAIHPGLLADMHYLMCRRGGPNGSYEKVTPVSRLEDGDVLEVVKRESSDLPDPAWFTFLYPHGFKNLRGHVNRRYTSEQKNQMAKNHLRRVGRLTGTITSDVPGFKQEKPLMRAIFHYSSHASVLKTVERSEYAIKALKQKESDGEDVESRLKEKREQLKVAQDVANEKIYKRLANGQIDPILLLAEQVDTETPWSVKFEVVNSPGVLKNLTEQLSQDEKVDIVEYRQEPHYEDEAKLVLHFDIQPANGGVTAHFLLRRLLEIDLNLPAGWTMGIVSDHFRKIAPTRQKVLEGVSSK